MPHNTRQQETQTQQETRRENCKKRRDREHRCAEGAISPVRVGQGASLKSRSSSPSIFCSLFPFEA